MQKKKFLGGFVMKEKEKFNIELQGDFTAVEPIFQFAPSTSSNEKKSSLARMNTMTILTPNGFICEIPVVSGNSVRGGILRDNIAYDLARLFGPGQASLKFLSVIFTGGTMEKKKSSKSGNKKEKKQGNSLNTKKKHELIQKVIDTNVVVSLLGCSLKYDMIKGKTVVSPFIPVCKETESIIDYARYKKDADEDDPESLFDDGQNLPALVLRDRGKEIKPLIFVKQDDIKKPELFKLLNEAGVEEYIKQAEEYQEYKDEKTKDRPVMRQMIYGIDKYIPAGMELYQSIECWGVTSKEFGAIIKALKKFAESGCRLGALHSLGFGRITGSYTVFLNGKNHEEGYININSDGCLVTGDFLKQCEKDYEKYLKSVKIEDLKLIEQLL